MNSLIQVLVLAADEPQKLPEWVQFVPIVVITVFFYLLILKPQSEQKKHRSMLGELKKNDKVVTIGGIIGTVAEVNNDRVTLKVDDSTRLKFRLSAISGRYEESSASDAKTAN